MLELKMLWACVLHCTGLLRIVKEKTVFLHQRSTGSYKTLLHKLESTLIDMTPNLFLVYVTDTYACAVTYWLWDYWCGIDYYNAD